MATQKYQSHTDVKTTNTVTEHKLQESEIRETLAQINRDFFKSFNITPDKSAQNINAMNSILTDIHKSIHGPDVDANSTIDFMNQIFNRFPIIDLEKDYNSLMSILRKSDGIKGVESSSSQINELYDKAAEIAESCGIDVNKLSESATLAAAENPSHKSTLHILFTKLSIIFMILGFLNGVWNSYRIEVASTKQAEYEQGQAEYQKISAEALAKIANALYLQSSTAQAPVGNCACPMHEQVPLIGQDSPLETADSPSVESDTSLDNLGVEDVE